MAHATIPLRSGQNRYTSFPIAELDLAQASDGRYGPQKRAAPHCASDTPLADKWAIRLAACQESWASPHCYFRCRPFILSLAASRLIEMRAAAPSWGGASREDGMFSRGIA